MGVLISRVVLILKKVPDFNTLFSDFDICCLQEIWLEHKDIVDIPGFERFRSERKNGKTAYKNSEGVLMLYKSRISDGITRMPSTNKHFIWIKLNSDFFGLEEDLWLVHPTFKLRIF